MIKVIKVVNGIAVELTEEEVAQIEAEAQRADAEYWRHMPYDDLVNNEIRKRYSVSQEFSILRQKEEKPEEYNAYFQFCEECKALVKSKMQ